MPVKGGEGGAVRGERDAVLLVVRGAVAPAIKLRESIFRVESLIR